MDQTRNAFSGHRCAIPCQVIGRSHLLNLDQRRLAVSSGLSRSLFSVGHCPLMVCKVKLLSGKSWAPSNRMKRDLAIRALNNAVVLRQPPKGSIHHTDRGSQYCSNDDQKLLTKHSFEISMSGKRNCYPSRDHAAHNPAGRWIMPWLRRS